MIKIYKLGGYPSFIKFSRTSFVAVGYLDGRVEFLEAEGFGVREEKIFLDWDYQPVNIVFSENDSKIAVIFLK